MKRSYFVGLLAAGSVLLTAQTRAATSYGVNFQGRDGTTSGNPGVPGLSSSQSAGVVPQGNWNNIDDQYGFTPPNIGTAVGLGDQSGVGSPVSLTFDCNDSWYNDVNPTAATSANSILMNGIIKVSAGGGVPGRFTFTGVPEGQYDLYVYTDMNGDNVQAAYSDSDFLTTYYVTLQHQFYDTNTFVQGTNTDPNGPGLTNVINYVKFSNLGTYGRGQVGVIARWLKNSDGLGVAGLQLVNVGPATANTNALAITKQPASRRVLVGDTNVVVSVDLATRGPVFSYQWFKNSTSIPGATNAIYAVPAIAQSDNGASFYVVISNNVNVVQSSNAVITVGALTAIPGAHEQLWFGQTRASIEDGTTDTITPDKDTILSSFRSPDAQGDNFAEKVDGLFIAPVTGDYVFFINSDDDSDLFLSTDATPAKKQLIAQEVDWAADEAWISNDGGTANHQVSQKRSDQWVPDPANPPASPPFTNGIHLVAGSQYYLEAVHHEGGGGDEVGVTYKLKTEPDPKNGDPTRIVGFLLAPFAQGLNGGYIVVTNPPQNTSALQSQKATFTVGATSGYVGDTSGAAPGMAFQWQVAPGGSSTFTNIIGANATSYTTPVLKLTDSGSQYRVTIIAADATTNSAAGTLTVLPDTVAPRPVTVVSVAASGKSVVLQFNELMDKASAETAANYVFNPGNIAGTAASLDSSQMTVTITTGTALTQNVTNVLAITGVKDLAGNPVAANTTIAFTYHLVTYEADILFDAPIGYYRFEDASGSATAKNAGSTGGDGAYYTGDETSAGSGGTPSSAKGDPGPRPPQFVGFQADNHSATFGGSDTQDWVDTKNQFLQNRGAFTLEYWVSPANRVSDPTTFGTRIGLVGQNDAIEYGFIDANTIQIWTPNGGSLNTTYTNADGEWHHVATIADGTNLKTYYDGVLMGTSGNATGNYGTSTYNVHIGGGGVFDATGNYFTGNIDEVAIFDKAIPAARVAEHFNAGKNGGVVTQSGAVTPPEGGGGGNGPRLTVSRSGNTLTISWSPSGGTLQSKPSLDGLTTGWTDVGTANPATVQLGAGNSFYRVKQ